MRILIAPNFFKESLSSKLAADAIEAGLKKSGLKTGIVKIPLADGGDGTVDAVLSSKGGKKIKCRITGPLGKKITAHYGIFKAEGKKTAVIEMALSSGLSLVPLKKRNPLYATTYGTGELIKDALKNGCKKIIVGIGGSATVDGGMGLAQALGVKFFDKNGKKLGLGGRELERIAAIDSGAIVPELLGCEIVAATDVKNPLYGKTGAAHVFGPQKGATASMVKRLDTGMKNYAGRVKEYFSKNINIPGSGAGGGTAAGLYGFFGGKIISGVELMMNYSGLEKHVKNSDLVITGEGKIDSQTLFGKTVFGVVRAAKKYNKPVVCFAGSVEPDAKVLYKYGVIGLFDIVPFPCSLEYCLKNAEKLLINSSENAGYLLKKCFCL